MSEYEHESRKPPRSGWWIVVVICASLAAWGLVQYATIRDAPRQWDFGALPDVPGQSIYSTSQPAQPKPAPPQMQPLPEARTQPGGTGASARSRPAPIESSALRPAGAQSLPAAAGARGRPAPMSASAASGERP